MADELTNIHAIDVVIRQRPADIIQLSIADHPKYMYLVDLAKQLGLRFHVGDYCKALVKRVKAKTSEELVTALSGSDQGVVLCLDGVVDPHNFGACMRSAAAFGVIAVVIPQDRSCPINSTVRNISCGGADHTPIYSVVNLSRTIKQAQDLRWWVYGASEHAHTAIQRIEFDRKSIVVVGNEGHGLRNNTLKHCDELFHIPTVKPVKSLNVSVSTGVILSSFLYISA